MRYLILLFALICIGCGDPADSYKGKKPFPIGSQVKYKTGDTIYIVVEYGNYLGMNEMKITYGEGRILFIDQHEYSLLEEVKE